MEVPKLHVLVPQLAFLGNFIIVLKRISAINLKNTLKLSRNAIWMSKTTILFFVFVYKHAFDKNQGVFFLNFSRSSRARAGPIRAHMGPYGPIWTRKI